jgi:hypothetical protein
MSIISSILIYYYLINLINTLGCFKCSTLNNDYACDDPFSPGLSNRSYYDHDCLTGNLYKIQIMALNVDLTLIQYLRY